MTGEHASRYFYRVQYRNSATGRFCTRQYAKRFRKTTEQQRIRVRKA